MVNNTPVLSWKDDIDKILWELDRSDDKAFREWLESRDYTDGRLFDPLMYARCYNIYKSVMYQDQDHFIVITGAEGSGKSTLCYQLCAVLDPTLDASHIVHDQAGFVNWLKHGKRGQTVWIDEGVLVLFGRESLGKKRSQMIKLITLMRQAGLIIAICIPEFKDLDSKVRDARTDTLIRCFKLERRRGYKCYNKRGARHISRWMKRGMVEQAVRVPHGLYFPGGQKTGYFSARAPEMNDLSWEGYVRAKRDGFHAFIDEVFASNAPKPAKPATVENAHVQPTPQGIDTKETKAVFMRQRAAADLLGVPIKTMTCWVHEKRAPSVKVGGRRMIVSEWVYKMLREAKALSGKTPEKDGRPADNAASRPLSITHSLEVKNEKKINEKEESID